MRAHKASITEFQIMPSFENCTDLLTANNWKLFRIIRGQPLVAIKIDLRVDGGIVILPRSFICFSFHKDIETSVMLGDCEGIIGSPQESAQVGDKAIINPMYTQKCHL